jgi:glycosyltransferase involved in cell wall biosynthesis
VVQEGVDDRFRARLEPSVVADVCRRYRLPPGGYVVTVGAVGPRKNLGLLLDALAGINAVARPLLAVVGADGGAGASLREHATRAGVADHVRWTGRVSDADLVALVQGARVLAHPSHYEGFGLTPLEAMAAGTPVVASASGSVPEVVGDAGLLLDPDDPAAWSDALARLAGDDATATDLAALGTARAAAFSWDRTARETWRIYDTLA